MIVRTGASWLSGRSRSFFIHLLMHFLFCTLNTECQFMTWKNIPLNNRQDLFLHTFPCRNQKQRFLLHVDCDLTSFNTALKIHQIQTKLSDMFSPLCLQTLGILWCCCLSLRRLYSSSPCAIHLSVPNTDLYSHDSGILCCGMTLIRVNGCMPIPPSHLYCMCQNCGQHSERSPAWIWLQNFTLRAWTCLLLKFKCEFCRERSPRHDWNMWAAGCQLVPHFKWGLH